MFGRRRSLAASIGASWLALLLFGCDGPATDPVPVRGQVKFQGQPIAGGSIVFAPDTERGPGRDLAIGRIEADGSYRIETDKGPNVAPGWYRISIVAASPARHGFTPRLPDKYRDPLRSGLEGQVRAGGENVFDFDLQ